MYTLVNDVVTYVDEDGEVSPRIGGVIVRAPYAYDADRASDDAGLVCADATLCKQSFQDESDINTLVQRFGLGYQIPEGTRVPTYGDFTGVNDYHSAANALASARESFDALPAAVRTRFANDPGAFVAFCSNEDNRGELVKMGLIDTPLAASPTPPVASDGVAAPIVNPTV